jgi:hypothetical protein
MGRSAWRDFFGIDQSVTDKDWSLYSFTLTTPVRPTACRFAAHAHQATGQVYFDDFAVVEGNVTRVKDGGAAARLCARAELSEPFNPARIFSLPKNAHVKIKSTTPWARKCARW